MRRSLISLSLLTIVASISISAFAAGDGKPSKFIRVGSDKIPEQYVVVLDDTVLPEAVPETARILAAAHGATVETIWNNALKAFFVRMSEEKAETLSKHPLVKFVEENAPWYITASPKQTFVDPRVCDPETNCGSGVVDNRLWHLDRLDQASVSPTESFAYCATGQGVTVYVVDGGIKKDHQEFDPARIDPGFNAAGTGTPETTDQMPPDDPCLGWALAPTGTGSVRTYEENQYRNEVLGSGHGTSVASLIAGRRIGVAPQVTLVPVKVIRCDAFSARARVNQRSYAVNETMQRLSSSGGSVLAGTLYRAIEAGTTLGSDPGSWPTTDGATKVDGTVTWQVVPESHGWKLEQPTTQAMLNAFSWIVDETATRTDPAIVSISMGRLASVTGYAGPTPSVEAYIQTLLAAGVTVLAAANNQNGNACDTIPARTPGVITVGGTMLKNRPWAVDISDETGAKEADGPIFINPPTEITNGTEPTYDWTQPVQDARWICGAGDSSAICSNGGDPKATVLPDPASAQTYHGFQGGSNAGPCVTLFASAKNVIVASPAGSDKYRDPRLRGGHASGTSFSTPIVVGVAAHMLQANRNFTPAQVRDGLIAMTVPFLEPESLNTYQACSPTPCEPTTQITGTPNRLLRIGNVTITGGPVGASSPGGTTLSVTATGSALSYQWYRVKAGFNPAATRGAFPDSPRLQGASEPMFGAVSSTYTVTTSGRYWVRVTSPCGSADSDIVTATAPPPSSLIAEATGAQTIHLSWQSPNPPVANASYRIRFRTAVNSDWIQIPGTISGTTLDHENSLASTMYQYEVRLTDNLGNSSPPIMDYAVTKPFTDDPVTTTISVKGVHIAELREAADAWRVFTNIDRAFPSYSTVTGTVYASHWNDVIAALNAARGRLALQAFGYTAGVATPASGVSIRREHVQEIRSALK